MILLILALAAALRTMTIWEIFDAACAIVGKGVIALLLLFVLYRVVRRLIWGGRLAATWSKPGSSTPVPRRVLITGCDTGFGAAVAKHLHGLGYFVYAGCLQQSTVDKLAEGYEERMTGLVMDVCKDEDVQAAVARVEEDGEGLWAIVNNAGINVGGLADWTPMSSFEKVMAVNYFGTVRVAKAFMPLLRESKGRVVNIASAAGFISFPGTGSYCGSKHAVNGFSDSLRYELRPWGVKVVVLEPGFFRTPIVELSGRVIKGLYDKLPQAKQDMYGPEFLEHSIKTTKLAYKLSGDPQAVVDAMTDAISLKHPFSRYQVGKDCKYLYTVLSMLPTAARDAMVAGLDRLGPKPAALTPGYSKHK